jgi:ATP-dependent RNA helicase DeaD
MSNSDEVMPTEAVAPTGADYVGDRNFSDFPISEATLRGVLELGFVTSTPVQDATIDGALAGRDMIVRAKTGTGKTAAFCVPMVERTPEGMRKPFALVLEPTRELAQQTAEQMVAIARYRDISVVTLVGGVAMGPQEDALKAGAEIIVGTPGRVIDHIRRGNLSPSEIQIVCLDEADEMLSMGFYEDVTKIVDKTHADRQVLLFSATISGETQRLVQRYLHDPEEIMLSTDADGVDLIHHVLYETSAGLHKARALLYLLDIEDPASAIIFCNTREDTATVASYLDRQGLDAQLISGELTQARRSAVMQKVKQGEVRFLVATDVAARGIDISDLSHVINYSLPTDPAVYLHRTGRTGRIGKEGRAISLVGPTDLHTRNMLEGRHGIKFERKDLPDPEIAVRMRVERQAKQIKAALGSLVFESYMPTVRALLERPDGHMLLAAALRAFFQWDRTQRAAASGEESTIDALMEQRANKEKRREERDGDGPRGRRTEGRGERRSEGRGDGRGDSRDRDRSRDQDRRPAAGPRTARPARRDSDEDLDALLLTDEPAPKDTLDDVLLLDDAPAAPADGGDKRKKRKKKRRKEGAGEASADAPEAEGEADGAGDADIDALLSFE